MRNLFSTILIIISVTAFSQVQKGTTVVDLSMSYSNANGNTFFFIQPLIGFGTNENKLLYAGIGYSHQKSDFSGDTDNLTSLIIGYEEFIELNPKVYFAPFISAAYGFGKSDNGPTRDDVNSLSLTLRPRLHYFMNNKWSVVASVGAIQYSRQEVKGATGESTSDLFTANLNASNVFFGIRLNLNNE